MKNIFFAIVICAILITSCTKDKSVDPFLVQKNQIGLLTDSTQVKDLETIFSNDSVVRYIAGDEFTGSVNTIEMIDKLFCWNEMKRTKSMNFAIFMPYFLVLQLKRICTCNNRIICSPRNPIQEKFFLNKYRLSNIQ